MVTAYVGLGSNMGDCKSNLCSALSRISAVSGIQVSAVSSWYKTTPWGLVDQPWFLNGVAALVTQIPPEALLRVLLDIEGQLGRTREVHWGPRVVDLDLLTYGQTQMTTEFLTLPHPLLTTRAFVLEPLHELASDLLIYGAPVKEHLRALAPTRQPDDVLWWGPPPERHGNEWR